MKLHEIESIFKRDFDPGVKKFNISEKFADLALSKMKSLPDNDRYAYMIGDLDPIGSIYVFDPNNLTYIIGKLDLMPAFYFDKTMNVQSIMVHPKYRGQGIAKSLYKLVLMPRPYGLGMTLVSDDTQTPGGRKNWVSISQIPGIDVTGLIRISKEYENKHINNDETGEGLRIIVDLIGKVGGVYYGENALNYFFQIPVGATSSKLENKIKSSLIKIYPHWKMQGYYQSYLMAKYVGGT